MFKTAFIKPTTCLHPEPHQPSPYPPPYLLDSRITLPSISRSYERLLSIMFAHQNPAYTSHLPPYVLHAPPISFLMITPTILGEQYRSLNSSLYSLLQSPLISSLFGPNTPSVPLTETPSAYEGLLISP